MKRTYLVALCLAGMLTIAILMGSGFSRSTTLPESVLVDRGAFTVWTVYEGQLESRRIEAVRSSLSGSAPIIEIAPEGAFVETGDLLVRFDCSSLERELVRMEKELALAKSDLNTLKFAQIPMQLEDLNLQILEARTLYESERQFLEDSVSLVDEGLISEQELRQQEQKLEPMRLKLEGLELKRELLQEHEHPASLERAEAGLLAATRSLELEREQSDSCSVLAPAPGMVIYRATHMGGEYRTVRVGDTVWKNQVFMEVQDMTDLVANFEVPEAELGRVGEGRTVTITPVAYPDLSFEGVVEAVGSMARSLNSKPSWQKYFHVQAGLQGEDPRLRAGMSVRAAVLSYQADDVVRIPRLAVRWHEGRPTCMVLNGRRQEARELTLGQSNDQFFEVLEGVRNGEKVAVN